MAIDTLLQDEVFHFCRMGTFLERADNTARLLDVKFHAVRGAFFGAALSVVSNDHSGETLRRAGKLKADLQYARIDEMPSTGLHAFLTRDDRLSM